MYFLVPSFYLVVGIKGGIKWRVVWAIKRSSVNEETLFPTLQRVLEKVWLKEVLSWKLLLIRNNMIVQKLVFYQAEKIYISWMRGLIIPSSSRKHFAYKWGFLASLRLLLVLQANLFIKKKVWGHYMIIASLKKWGFVSLFIISFHDKEHYLPISFPTTQVFT